MKLRISVLIGILFVTLALPVHADSDVKAVLTMLPTGLKVVVREGHAVDLVALDIWVRAGSVNETEATNGISHLCEHMIFKATKKYGPGEADREIEGLGAELNGGTSKDWVHFYTTVAGQYLPVALSVLGDAITNAQFRPEDIEKERLVLADEIARADGSPTEHAFSLFSKAVFRTHPYRLDPTGSKDVIAKVTRDELMAYYKRYYTPANTVISIAGDVSAAEAVAMVRKAFGDFDRASKPSAPPPDESPILSPRVEQFESRTARAYVVLGYVVPPVSEFRTACALDVILALLGDTYRGRVCSALTAKGVRFDTIKTDFVSQKRPSTIETLVVVDPADESAAVEALRDEYLRLADEPVRAGELDEAKRLVVGGDLFDQETFSGQARVLGLYESIGSYDMALKYGSTVGAITAADVSDVAVKYFGPDDYCLVKIEPRQAGK